MRATRRLISSFVEAFFCLDTDFLASWSRALAIRVNGLTSDSNCELEFDVKSGGLTVHGFATVSSTSCIQETANEQAAAEALLAALLDFEEATVEAALAQAAYEDCEETTPGSCVSEEADNEDAQLVLEDAQDAAFAADSELTDAQEALEECLGCGGGGGEPEEPEEVELFAPPAT